MTEVVNGTFGARVRSEREKQSLSKSALANKVGISTPYVDKIETGESIPTVDIAGRIAKVLEISLEEIFGEILTSEEIDQEIDDLLQNIHVQFEADLAFRGFGYKHKKAVLQLLRSIEQQARKRGD